MTVEVPTKERVAALEQRVTALESKVTEIQESIIILNTKIDALTPVELPINVKEAFIVIFDYFKTQVTP